MSLLRCCVTWDVTASLNLGLYACQMDTPWGCHTRGRYTESVNGELHITWPRTAPEPWRTPPETQGPAAEL